jgi:hypothetical protein
MKKRAGLWVVVAVVAVFGGFALLARWFLTKENFRTEYEAAVSRIRSEYCGSECTFVPLADPRTRITRTKDGYELRGVFRSNLKSIDYIRVASPTGELEYHVELREVSHGLFQRSSYEIRSYGCTYFDPRGP